MNLDWSQWLYGLFAALIGGGASAVSGGIVLNAQDGKDYNFGDPRIYKVMGFMFVVNGLLSAFFYLKQHPLPEVVTKVTTTETSVLPTHPPVTVTKKVEETTTGTADVKPKDEPKP